MFLLQTTKLPAAAMPPTIVHLIMVTSPRRADHFMHAAGMFESCKRLIHRDIWGFPAYQHFELTVDAGSFDLTTTVAALRKIAGTEGNDSLLACFIPGQNGGWKDETCRIVSTGQSWCSFDQLLQRWGFVPSPPGQS
jgi:hypothetical protein